MIQWLRSNNLSSFPRLVIPQTSSDILSYQEFYFKLNFEDFEVCMGLSDKDGNIIEANTALCKFLGYSKNEIEKLSIVDVTHPEDRDKTQRYLKEVMLGKRNSYVVEKRYLHKAGHFVWGQVMSAWVFDDDKKLLYGIAVILDITEKKRADEEKIQRLKRVHLQQTTIVKITSNPAVINGDFENAAKFITESAANVINLERVGIWLLSEDKKELRCASQYIKSARQHTQGTVLCAKKYPRYFEALNSDRVIDVHDAQNDLRTNEFNENYLVPLNIHSMLDAGIRISGKLVGVVCHEHVGPSRVWTADETSFASEIADQVAQLILNCERRIAVENLHKAHDELERRVKDRTAELTKEIAQRKKSQSKEKELRAQLLQAEKLSSIGLLAAGLAHELNNPLTGILSLIRTYRKGKNVASSEYEHFTDMLEAAEHMAKIIEDLNYFSSVSEGDFVELNWNTVVEATLSFSVHQFIRDNIKVKKIYTEKLPEIKGDKAQLQQVVLNLLTNARDAMEETGGEVTIITRHDTQRDAVVLEVIDTGTGIAIENMPKIFDPFFTTKVLGKGIGLGLSVSHGIVKAHRGEIEVESSPQSGTKFSIFLPVV